MAKEILHTYQELEIGHDQQFATRVILHLDLFSGHGCLGLT